MDEGASRGSGTRTVLFTDVVGSTAVRSRLGDVAADEVRRDHDEVLQSTVGVHAGTVVKGLGDGLMAVFESAASAAACAVAMHQALERKARRGGEALSIRIGLAAGDVAWERGDYFGTPVVEAARLEAAADGGQILASDLVRLLAGSRAEVIFRPVGSLALKGLSEPLSACEVPWEPLGLTGPIPLPPMLTVLGGMPFVGRDEERAGLERVWDDVRQGRPRTVLVTGEAGIGKTRMASELAGQVHEGGGIILAGRCEEDLAVPYQPFAEALRQFVSTSSDRLLERVVGRHAAELRRLVPEIVERLPGTAEPINADPETERYRLFEAVVGWLERTAAEEPTLLVLDDLHWATKPTVLLLGHLHRSQRPGRLLVVGTYRPTDVDLDHPLTQVLADLRRGPDADRLDLAGLDQAGVEAIFADQLARPLSPEEADLARAIHAGSAGNAFFAGELVRHVLESDGRGDRDPLVPETVRDVVALRTAKLPEAATDVLVIASVLGLDFDLRVLAATADQSEACVLDAMEAASAARLVQETTVDRYQFAHGLVRDTLYSGLSRSRRLRLHRMAVEGLMAHATPDGGEDVVALAHHLGVVASEDPRRIDDARAYAARAGDQALVRLAPEEAARHYQTALDLLTPGHDDEERCRLLVRRADAFLQAGQFEDAQGGYLAAAGLARELPSPALLAQAALGCAGPPHYRLSRDEVMVPLLEEALSALAPMDPVRQRVMATLALRLPDGTERRQALTSELEGQLDDVDDPVVAGLILDCCFWEFERPPEERLGLGERMADLAARSGDMETAGKAAVYPPIVLLELGHGVEARRSHERASTWAASAGQSYYRAVLTMQRNQLALLDGRFDDVELDPGALSLDEQEGSISRFLHWILDVQQLQLHRELGRAAELTPKWRELVSGGVAQGLHLFEPFFVVVLLDAGTRGEASSMFDSVAADGFADLPRRQDPMRPFNLALLAEACWRLGAVGAAPVLYDLLLPYEARAAMISSLLCLGSQHRYLGLLAMTMGRHDEAERHLEEGRRFNQRLGSPPVEAHVAADLADLLDARGRAGDRERAADLRRRCADAATALGMTALLSRLGSTSS